MKTIFLKILAIAFIQNTCRSQILSSSSHEIKMECGILNDSAVVVYDRWLQTKDSSFYNRATSLIAEAVECDSAYLTALNNQFSFYFMAEQFKDCLVPLMKMSVLTNDREPYPYQNLSICYKHLGKNRKSERNKKLALNIAKKNFAKDDSFENFKKLVLTNHELNEREEAQLLFDKYRGIFSSRSKEIEFLKEYLLQKSNE